MEPKTLNEQEYRDVAKIPVKLAGEKNGPVRTYGSPSRRNLKARRRQKQEQELERGASRYLRFMWCCCIVTRKQEKDGVFVTAEYVSGDLN